VHSTAESFSTLADGDGDPPKRQRATVLDGPDAKPDPDTTTRVPPAELPTSGASDDARATPAYSNTAELAL